VGDPDADRRRAVRGWGELRCLGAHSNLADPRRRAFRSDFARSIKRADRLQPALLVVAIVSTAGFAISAAAL
jgi:hypothetical protein